MFEGISKKKRREKQKARNAEEQAKRREDKETYLDLMRNADTNNFRQVSIDLSKEFSHTRFCFNLDKAHVSLERAEERNISLPVVEEMLRRMLKKFHASLLREAQLARKTRAGSKGYVGMGSFDSDYVDLFPWCLRSISMGTYVTGVASAQIPSWIPDREEGKDICLVVTTVHSNAAKGKGKGGFQCRKEDLPLVVERLEEIWATKFFEVD